jgi:hypothetical protein
LERGISVTSSCVISPILQRRHKMPVLVTLPFQPPTALVNGLLADASQVFADFQAITQALSTSAASAGANSDITSLNGLTSPIGVGLGGTTAFIGTVASTGSPNTQLVNATIPSSFIQSLGYRVFFIAGFTNTGPMTLNVRSTGAAPVLRITPTGPQALTGGEVVAGNMTEVVVDGMGNFHLVTTQAQFGGYGPFTNITIVSNVADLGTAPTHNIIVSGSGPINSFGASANITYPVYLLNFSTSVQLTYNPTALILPGLANITTQPNDTAVAVYLGGGNWQLASYQRAATPPYADLQSTRQVPAGSGTYVTPLGAKQLKIRMIGGGGSGGGIGLAGTAGTASTFAGINAQGGLGGGAGSATLTPGAGGAGGSGGTGTASLRFSGNPGGGGIGMQAQASGGGVAASMSGGIGGAGNLGNAGAGGAGSSNTAAASIAASAGGGGAGEYVEIILSSLIANYSYVVGTGGSGGGTAGQNGVIVVDEYY